MQPALCAARTTGPSISAGRSKYRYYGGTVYKVKDVVESDNVPPADKMINVQVAADVKG